MRVALSFPGCHRRGGVERVMLECANYLSERGHDVHAFATDWDTASLNPKVARHPVAASSRPPTARAWTYRRRSGHAIATLQPRPDIVGGFGVLSPPQSVIWVQSVHAAWLEISGVQREWRGRWRQHLNPFHRVILRMERECYGGGRYRKLIALSDRVADDLKRIYDVPDQHIVVIPNGFSPSEFNDAQSAQRRETKRRELGYSDDDKVVIFVANELERKGFGPLLQGIAALQNPHLHLLAVGRLDAQAYSSRIAALGLSNRVRFTGPTSEVANFYAAADVFALPTQYEAWGLVVVEAMACGLPALTSRLAGAAIAVREGQTGHLLDDPADTSEIAAKLDALLHGQIATRAEIAGSVVQYSWPAVLPRYEQLLLECSNRD